MLKTLKYVLSEIRWRLFLKKMDDSGLWQKLEKPIRVYPPTTGDV